MHGRLDLLAEMHAQIAADIMRVRPADWRIVHLGDYVDRGPDSRGVIEFLMRQTAMDGRNISLAGNHDIGFLDFLAEPQPDGLFAAIRWRPDGAVLWGGARSRRHGRVSARAAARSRAAVPRSHVDFLHAT